MAFVKSALVGLATGANTGTITSVTAGNTLVVAITQVGSSAGATFTVSSNNGGAFQETATYSPSRGAHIFHLHSALSGSHTITVTPSTSVSYAAVITEWSGLDSAASPIVPSPEGFNDAGDVSDHFCAPSGQIDTSGGSAIVCACSLSSATGVTGFTPTTGFTRITSANGQHYVQYYDSPSAETDQRAAWSHSGTARQAFNTMAAFPYATGGATPRVSATWFGR